MGAISLEFQYEWQKPNPHWICVNRGVVCSVVLYLLLIPTAILIWTKRKEYWKEGILLVLSCIVALVAGQLFVMIVYPELSAPDLAAVRERKYHHIYPPDTVFYEKFSEDIEMEIKTNSNGFRSRYNPEDFREHSTRVAVLGDSFTFGLGVERDQTFSAVLESMIENELETDAAVLNCGIVSYSPLLESILYEGIVEKYRPNYTLLFLDATDFSDDVRYLSQAIVDEGEMVFEIGGNEQFQYWGFVIESFLEPTLVKPILFPIRKFFVMVGLVEPHRDFNLYDTKVVIDGEPNHKRFFIYYFSQEKLRPYFEQTYSHIERIYRHAQSIGSEFALIVTPRYHHWNLNECPENWESHQYTGFEPYQFEYLDFFDKKSRESPFPILNLLPAFQETDRFPLVFVNDPHWNAEGHQLVGEKTFEFMKETYFSGP